MNVTETRIKQVSDIAVKAGEAIFDIYRSGEKIKVSLKSDHSPLTIADKQAHDIIVQGLADMDANVPILSEEGADIPYDQRRHYEYFWCVDPLDGTKEFISRRDEFTVNIALIHINRPVLGIIYAPVYKTLYTGCAAFGSWRKGNDQPATKLGADTQATEWTAIGSRSHASAEENEALRVYPVVRNIAAGSSLKFCRIAEGAAHIYYRQGPTMEWDTAAGQAIAESSGAVMKTIDGKSFLYNKPSLLNGGFICKVR